MEALSEDEEPQTPIEEFLKPLGLVQHRQTMKQLGFDNPATDFKAQTPDDAQAEEVTAQAEAATAQAAAVRAAAVTTQAQMEVEEVEAETPAAIYACCTSQSNTAVWQCNVCRLWFHNACMKKKGDSANPMCESCLIAATEKGPRAKRGRGV